MILTITMNPSIDIAYQVNGFKLDTTNRTQETHKTPGGKGLNVTRVLSQLGENVVASGLIGGKHGEFLTSELDKANVKHDFYHIKEETRNCIAILHDNQQTEILEQGPSISAEESDEFLEFFKKLILDIDIVAISGSLPKGLSTDYYTHLVKTCHESKIPVVVDTSGASLEAVLNSDVKPTVVKPNTEELSQLLGKKVTSDVSLLKESLEDDQFEGMEWVIVSLGSEGAFAKHKDTYYRVKIPKISVVNPTGSGDSTVAGITSALFHKESDEVLLKKANVLGMLNALEKQTGYVNMSNYDELFNQIKVEEV